MRTHSRFVVRGVLALLLVESLACSNQQIVDAIVGLATAPDLTPTGYAVTQGDQYEPVAGYPLGPRLYFKAEITNVGKTDKKGGFEVKMRVIADCLINSTVPACLIVDDTQTLVAPASTVIPANGGSVVTSTIVGNSAILFLSQPTKYKISIEVDDINLDNNRFETQVLDSQQLIDSSRPTP